MDMASRHESRLAELEAQHAARAAELQREIDR
jgi:hypothetical protein